MTKVEIQTNKGQKGGLHFFICVFLLSFPSKLAGLRTVSRMIWALLVIEIKNYCLKRCENCSLKSVIEKRVFSVYKTKKCVWYHGLNNVFQC